MTLVLSALWLIRRSANVAGGGGGGNKQAARKISELPSALPIFSNPFDSKAIRVPSPLIEGLLLVAPIVLVA